jgi:transcriptional regulator with XRE-family HTH domain
MAVPTSSNVMPVERSSVIRSAHVLMGGSLRDTVSECKRHPVTEFHDNDAMQKAVGYPKTGHLGERLKWWREHRHFSRKQLVAESGVPYSTIAEIENEEQHSSTKVTQLAAALRINPHYLNTGLGDPEDLAPVVNAMPSLDPLPGFDLTSIDDFDPNERELLALRMAKTAEEIRARRQPQKKKATN